MWLSGQQKRPAEAGEGQTGTVTISEDGLAVQLDSERRGLEVYGPAGYVWTPRAGQRVLVIKNKGETPCIVGAKQDDSRPEQVVIGAEKIDMQGQVLINGVPLKTYIAIILAELMGG